MNKLLITVGLLALLSTAAIVFVHHTQEADLEKFRIHIHKPHIHLPHLHLKNIGACVGVVTHAVSSCGAAYESAGGNITGDIGCVKSILSAKKCGHIF